MWVWKRRPVSDPPIAAIFWVFLNFVRRLGPGRDHTQYNLTPLPNFTHSIVQVAPGQDHTLALTSSAEVLSWGMNRFAQLGYVIEVTPSSGGVRTSSGLGHEIIQTAPRKIQGALKKVQVMGICTCKTASGCWSRGKLSSIIRLRF